MAGALCAIAGFLLLMSGYHSDDPLALWGGACALIGGFLFMLVDP